MRKPRIRGRRKRRSTERNELLIYLRRRHKLSQKEVAEAIGCSQSLYSRIERNVERCGWEKELALADLFQVRVEELFAYYYRVS